jgi:hypothetical protein
LLEDLEAIDLGESQVEEDEVRSWGLGRCVVVALMSQVVEGFLAVADMGQEVGDAEVLEVATDDFGVSFIIFYEEDMDGFAFDHSWMAWV